MWLAHHHAFGQWVGSVVDTIARSFHHEEGVLLLGRRDIAGLIGPADWVAAVEAGFRAAAEGRAAAPLPMEIGGSGGAFHAKGAALQLDRHYVAPQALPFRRPGRAALQLDRHYVALKLNGNFPGNADRGLPTIQGAILLCDGETGALLAIMDSIEVTLRRTAAATALAARHLARPDSRTLLVCGCGAQGRAQLRALREVLPLAQCLAWDRDFGRAQQYGREEGAEAVADLPKGDAADVVVTCTTATEPFLGPDQVGPGTFVAAVGADSSAKNEVKPALFEAALVVADVRAQCAVMGDLRHALAAGVDPGCVHAELAELVSGAKPGRTSPEQITLFDSTGTALQDVASAAVIYERALARGGMRCIALAA
ncbi:putative ornithine cyclodeaminase [Sphingomonas changbaiensis NBRC 104936]|uniref:Putative ornithine cyclodeaminase n=2 Tax=Sphingomonas changbaiensis TaxID=529705 RepID=A0A0E9MPN5_9SPHN|nr:putative ornithine cyclodeaminase [Sphingomonas changbaiensis NBRC 104936]